MAQISAPLRQLLEKDIAWSWETAQEQAFTTLKEASADLPALKFFNENESVCLSVYAGPKAMGAVLLQNGRPEAYASRASTKVSRTMLRLKEK